jgi:hypothetical protein
MAKKLEAADKQRILDALHVQYSMVERIAASNKLGGVQTALNEEVRQVSRLFQFIKDGGDLLVAAKGEKT